MTSSTIPSRLFAKIDKSGDCWLWTGARYQNGYGSFKISAAEGNDRAHRVMFRLVHGSIPTGRYVLHTCDVRLCVKPDHLYLGSQSDNIKDMHARNPRKAESFARGEKHNNAKLTEAAVRDIRQRYTGKYGNGIALAREFGVTPQLIRVVALRKGWKHVP